MATGSYREWGMKISTFYSSDIATCVVQCIRDKSELFEEVDIVTGARCCVWGASFGTWPHFHSLCDAVMDGFNADGGVKGQGRIPRHLYLGTPHMLLLE